MQQYAITVTIKPSKIFGGKFYDSLTFDKQATILNEGIRSITHYTGKASFQDNTQYALVDELIFEHHEEGKRRLHAHGLISTFPETLDNLVRELKYYFQTPDEHREWYNVRVEPIYFLSGWKKYIHKNVFDADRYTKQLRDPDAYDNEVEDEDSIFDTNIFIKQ